MKDSNKTKTPKKQKIAFSTNAIILMVVVVVVAVLLNIVVEQIPMNIDLTDEKLFTLTNTTETVLDGLEDDVTIYTLCDRVEGESISSVALVIKVLDIYDRHDKINVEYVDLDKKPSFLYEQVGELEAKNYSTYDFLVKCGDNTRQIQFSDMFASTYDENYQTKVAGLQIETKVTGAIVRVTSEVPVIYWSVAYDEAKMTDSYYKSFANELSDSNYDLREIDLKMSDIPDDASAIIFMSPKQDLNDEAADKLLTWFENKGGNALFFMDTSDESGKPIYQTFDNFNFVLERFNLKINTDIVDECEDYKYQHQSDLIFMNDTLEAGALEQTTSSRLYVLNTRSISILDTNNAYAETEAIMETSDEAVSKSLLDDKETVKGTHTIAASSKHTGGYETSRVVLFGSSANLRVDSLMMFGGVVPFGVVKDSLEWFDIETVDNPADGIKSKPYAYGAARVEIDTQPEITTVTVIVAVLYPLAILITGLVVWLKRRHL